MNLTEPRNYFDDGQIDPPECCGEPMTYCEDDRVWFCGIENK